MDEFGKRLKLLRTSKKLKQTDIASFLQLTIRHYQDIEYGKVNIPALTLIKLADFFDVSTDYLLGRSDNPERR